MKGSPEVVVRFGPGQSLSGIVTRPATAAGARSRAIIIPNTGIGHRASHHRLFVTFARALATAGYTVLRFDLSGLGDSLSRGSLLERTEAELADMRAAVDWLEGDHEIYLLGLCSGADRSIVYASQDKRVRGVMLIDPSIPLSGRQLVSLLFDRLRRSARGGIAPTIGKLFKRGAGKGGGTATVQRRGTGPLAWLSWYRLPAYLEAIYSRYVGNGGRLLAIFTSGTGQGFRYPRRIAEVFRRVRFGQQLTVSYLEGVHHLLVLEEERRRALDAMVEWLARQPADEAALVTRRANAPVFSGHQTVLASSRDRAGASSA